MRHLMVTWPGCLELAMVCAMMMAGVYGAWSEWRKRPMSHWAAGALMTSGLVMHAMLWRGGYGTPAQSAGTVGLSLALAAMARYVGVWGPDHAKLYLGLAWAMPPTLSRSAVSWELGAPALALAVNSLALYGLYESRLLLRRRNWTAIPAWVPGPSELATTAASTGGTVGAMAALLTYVVRYPLTLVEALAATIVLHLAMERWLGRNALYGLAASGWALGAWMWLGLGIWSELLALWVFAFVAVACYDALRLAAGAYGDPARPTATITALKTQQTNTPGWETNPTGADGSAVTCAAAPFGSFLFGGAAIMVVCGGTAAAVIGAAIAAALR